MSNLNNNSGPVIETLTAVNTSGRVLAVVDIRSDETSFTVYRSESNGQIIGTIQRPSRVLNQRGWTAATVDGQRSTLAGPRGALRFIARKHSGQEGLRVLPPITDAFGDVVEVHSATVLPPVETAPEAVQTGRSIDMTPTWSEIVDMLALAIENGGARGRDAAMVELKRMAKLADIAAIVMGSHRRPDAPAIPEATAILERLKP